MYPAKDVRSRTSRWPFFRTGGSGQIVTAVVVRGKVASGAVRGVVVIGGEVLASVIVLSCEEVESVGMVAGGEVSQVQW